MRRGVMALCFGLVVPVRHAWCQSPAAEPTSPVAAMSATAPATLASRRSERDSTPRAGPLLLRDHPVGVGASSAAPVEPIAPNVAMSSRMPARRSTPSWWPPVASAILPGAGQGLLRQDRALAFLAVESYGWLRYASDVREGRRQRSAYRSLAARVARANLSDERPVGDFEYYERMETYIESGVFDTSPDDGVQPEVNPESFNGFIWLRARTTFWEDPAIPPHPTSEAYFAALEYYSERAIQPQFRWSWRNAQLEQDLFRRTIGRSNDAFRRSIQDLGVIIANHALSTVDAYVTVRIRNARAGDRGVGVEASIPWSPGQGPSWAEDRRR
jgi:hypothetical protein